MKSASVISFLCSLLFHLSAPAAGPSQAMPKAQGFCPLMKSHAVCTASYKTGKQAEAKNSNGSPVSFSHVIEAAKKSRAIFVGELHSRPADHFLQLLIIKELHEGGDDISIGLEMFSSDRQADLDKWVDGSMEIQTFRNIYAKEWKMPWHLYEAIFTYARDHGIPLIGLNVPEKISSKVGKSGFHSLTPYEKKTIPSGISCRADKAYLEFIRKAYRQHKSGRMFRHFCEAQVLWNKAMARRVADYLSHQPERRMIVLTGIGHARKGGIPMQLHKYGNVPVTVILPGIDYRQLSRAEMEDADFFVP